MSTPLQVIEEQIKLLRAVELSTLDLESRIEYHTALIEAMTARLKNLLFYFKYKTALIVDAEIKDEEKALLMCYELLSEAEAKRLEVYLPKFNRFRDMAKRGQFTPLLSFNDIERIIRTTLFGVPYELLFEGDGFVITKEYPGLDIEAELIKLEEFCEANEFKLLDNEKRTKRKAGESDKALFLQVKRD